MICSQCGRKPAESGRETCFRCRVATVGVTFRGGAILGRRGWNTTQREYLERNLGASSGAEIARTRPDIAPADDF